MPPWSPGSAVWFLGVAGPLGPVIPSSPGFAVCFFLGVAGHFFPRCRGPSYFESSPNQSCKHNVCKWGAGPAPRTPVLIFAVQACMKHQLAMKQTHNQTHVNSFQPVIVSTQFATPPSISNPSVFVNGRGLRPPPPPNPPLIFAVQACAGQHVALKRACSKAHLSSCHCRHPVCKQGGRGVPFKARQSTVFANEGVPPHLGEKRGPATPGEKEKSRHTKEIKKVPPHLARKCPFHT